MVEVKQSLYICGALAALGGFLEVLATAVLAYPAARMQQGIKWSNLWLKGALILNIILQLLASIAGNLCSTWFGPISIAGPVFFAAQLVANLIIFWIVLGIENFTPEMQVGTYVIVVSVTLLLQVGPGVQEDQDFGELISEPWAAIWSMASLGAMAVTALPLMPYCDMYEVSKWKRYLILLVVRASSFSINLTTGRAVILDISNEWIIVSMVIKIVSGAIYTRAIVVQSTVVEQARFVPLNAVFTLVIVGLTGIIVWEDWRVVDNWIAYVCVFLLFGLGSFLLLGGDVRLLSEADPNTFRSTTAALAGIQETRELFDTISNVPVEFHSDFESDEDDNYEEKDLEEQIPTGNRRDLLEKTKIATVAPDSSEEKVIDRKELMQQSRQPNTRNILDESPGKKKANCEHRPWSSMRDLGQVKRRSNSQQSLNSGRQLTSAEAWKNLYTRPVAVAPLDFPTNRGPSNRASNDQTLGAVSLHVRNARRLRPITERRSSMTMKSDYANSDCDNTGVQRKWRRQTMNMRSTFVDSEFDNIGFQPKKEAEKSPSAISDLFYFRPRGRISSEFADIPSPLVRTRKNAEGNNDDESRKLSVVSSHEFDFEDSELQGREGREAEPTDFEISTNNADFRNGASGQRVRGEHEQQTPDSENVPPPPKPPEFSESSFDYDLDGQDEFADDCSTVQL